MSKPENASQSRTGHLWAISFFMTAFLVTVFSLAMAASPAMASQVDNIDFLHYTSVPGKSHLEINGTSTLHDWSAETHLVQGFIELIDDTDVGSCPEDKSFPLVAAEDVNLVFRIPVGALKSDSQGLDEEMRKGMNCAQHPIITFQFGSAAQVCSPDTHDYAFRVRGALHVNGVNRPTDFIIKVRHPSPELVLIETEVTVKMTDFKITPPSFMGGLLTSGDQVKIKLSWALAPS